MPGNLLAVDTAFPTFTPEQTTEQKLDVVTNYLYMLVEQLRYTLQNLGMGNFNGAELTELGLMISDPIHIDLESLEGNIVQLDITTAGISGHLEDVAKNVNDLSITAAGLSGRLSNAEGDITSLQATASGLRADLTDAEGNITALQATAGSLSSRITSAEGDISAIDQYARSITFSVQNGEDSSTIRMIANGVTVSSQVISMNGVVTFTDLSTSGRTTINGANITTGYIDADRLNLTGAITFSDLSSGVQSDIENASLDAQDALDAADDVSRTVDRWTYEGTTYIDGNRIMTGTVSASTLEGGEIYLLDDAGRRAGSFTLEGASSYSGRAIRIESGAIAIMSQAGDVYLESGDGATLQLSDDCTFASDICPSSSGRYSCGTSSRQWSDIYAESGVVSTSDENLKNSIEPLPEKYATMLDHLAPKRYRLNDGTSGRYHVGFIAQDVEQAMEAAGVSDLEFGGWIKDMDEYGNDIYLLRYNEFIAILLLKIHKLEQRVSQLEGAA